MDFLKDFGVKPILLAAQVVNFLILLFILKKFLYGPILKVLTERRKKIEDSLKNAEEIEKRLLETGEKANQILASAQSDGGKIIDEANGQANQIIEDSRLKAEIVAQKVLDGAKTQIHLERDNMERELQKDFSKVVMMVVQKVTGRLLNQKSQKDLVEKAVREFRS